MNLHANIRDDGSGKQVYLFCEDKYDQEEADALLQKIRKITTTFKGMGK